MLFLPVLTLLMDGVPDRSQKAAIFLGLLLGFQTVSSCFQITQIFLLTMLESIALAGLLGN